MAELSATAGRAAWSAKISYRQLDHWTSRGHLYPDNGPHPGTGRKRTWSDHELRVAETIWALKLAGLDLPTAARTARQACAGRVLTELGPGVWIVVQPAAPAAAS